MTKIVDKLFCEIAFTSFQHAFLTVTTVQSTHAARFLFYWLIPAENMSIRMNCPFNLISETPDDVRIQAKTSGIIRWRIICVCGSGYKIYFLNFTIMFWSCIFFDSEFVFNLVLILLSYMKEIVSVCVGNLDLLLKITNVLNSKCII